MNVIFDKWGPYLFVLTGNQHCTDTDQLQVFFSDDLLLQKPVNQVYSQEQRLNFELELEVHLDDPVDKNGAHPLCDVWLLIHVLNLRLIIRFC